MVNFGPNWGDVHWPDNWTATTVDGKRSAQFEETLLSFKGIAGFYILRNSPSAGCFASKPQIDEDGFTRAEAELFNIQETSLPLDPQSLQSRVQPLSAFLITMFSFRNVPLYLLAALAGTSVTFAAPTIQDVEARCDYHCQAYSHPVPVIIADIHAQIGPKCDEITAMTTITADIVGPIVADITAIIDGATAQVQAYVDAGVEVDIALSATVGGGVAVSVDVLVDLLVSLCGAIVAVIQVVLRLVVQVELSACIQICASLAVSLAAFLRVCGSLAIGLNVALAAQITVFAQLCVQLGVKAAIDFLGLNLDLGVGIGIGINL
ncbi:Methionine aminopeptidase 1 [Marasmius tenuissimus]|uniref:Methionine aminopeptidase 1 n=1 Tax=Marasmius tenuissimus TaxID=585030 RepID=A0ABR3A044_9AGAR